MLVRLDNSVYRLGFADSRSQARQLVQHGHFDVNGRRTNIPSFILRPGDQITVREGSRSKTYFKGMDEIMGDRPVPEWLSQESAQMSGSVVRLPERSDIDVTLREQLIVEYYSR